ncbi:MAG: hypothetical protein P4L71_06385 [Acetobacteraceae bacterium]|nr:hypothetical protein [Acetobacteraceae bacterium]
MAVNLAAKRGAKAQRRKAVLAAKRVLQTPASRMQEAAALPIQLCLLNTNLNEVGMGQLLLARGNSPVTSHLAIFLLDTYGAGVKDATFKTVDGATLRMYRETMEATMPMAPIEPADARKLLHDLVARSAAMGIRPHPDFAMAEKLFGTVSIKAATREFSFGPPAVLEALSAPGLDASIDGDDVSGPIVDVAAEA